MDQFAPFFNRKWLDSPRADHEHQVLRLLDYLNSQADQQSPELLQMRSTSRRLVAIQNALWRILPLLPHDPSVFHDARELFWVEMEIRAELRTDHIRLIKGSQVKLTNLTNTLFLFPTFS